MPTRCNSSMQLRKISYRARVDGGPMYLVAPHSTSVSHEQSDVIISKTGGLLLDIRSVNKGNVNGTRNVGRGEHKHVRVLFERVQLRQQRVHNSDGVGRVRSASGRLPRGRERLHFVCRSPSSSRYSASGGLHTEKTRPRTDQDADECLAIFHELLDLPEQLHYELPALGEPLASRR